MPTSAGPGDLKNFFSQIPTRLPEEIIEVCTPDRVFPAGAHYFHRAGNPGRGVV